MNKLYFVTQNPHKVDEVCEFLRGTDYEVVPREEELEELQTTDIRKIIYHKAIEAFKKVRYDLIVEHTGLFIPYLGNFPGGLTKLFWDELQADRFTELFGSLRDNTIIARTYVAYVRDMQIQIFSGEVEGTIATQPRGDRTFRWDCIFIPRGADVTFAEDGALKKQVSMRRLAYAELVAYLNGVAV